MATTIYTYDVQVTNSYDRSLHIYVEAATNTDAIYGALRQIGEWSAGGAITDIHVDMVPGMRQES